MATSSNIRSWSSIQTRSEWQHDSRRAMIVTRLSRIEGMVPVARGTVVDVVGGSFRTESSGGLVAAPVIEFASCSSRSRILYTVQAHSLKKFRPSRRNSSVRDVPPARNSGAHSVPSSKKVRVRAHHTCTHTWLRSIFLKIKWPATRVHFSKF